MKTQTNLYTRAAALYREILTLEQDLEALAAEFTYEKEVNEDGLEKKLVKSTMKAAEVNVRESVDKLEDKIAKEQEFVQLCYDLIEDK